MDGPRKRAVFVGNRPATNTEVTQNCCDAALPSQSSAVRFAFRHGPASFPTGLSMKSLLLSAVIGSSLLATAIAASTSAAPIAKSNPLRVGMVAATAPATGFLGAVEVTITNTSNKTARVPKWQLPNASGESELFRITRDGQPVEYVGKMVKRGVPKAKDFAILRPGQTIRTVVDLSIDYAISQPGQYSVTMAKPLQWASLSDGSSLKTPRGDFMLLQSAPLNLWLNASDLNNAALSTTGGAARGGSTVPGNPTLPPLGRDTSANPNGAGDPGPLRDRSGFGVNATYLNCSADRQALARTAIKEARTYTEVAKGYLNAGTVGTRYTWWFGTFLTARYNSAKQNFVNIDAAMDLNAGQVSINCLCDPGFEDSYAYVYPNDPYKIYVCNAFWAAPMLGTDSKAGTLIHEMSHFTIVADTDDWVYGQTGAHNLALSNPNQTSGNPSASVVGNADNHEYFGENTPNRN
ncbi:MAG: protease [Lysobacter sp.]|nr:protease [Lysobacter sp.]